ncbi:unnamed protein product [Rhizophagus irregularis]|nr:unnamed protein product [Rhizophagus irregularis]
MNSQNISKYFLNELESNHYCYQIKHHVIRTYGFTKDPNLNDYILVIQYAPGGDLHNYLQKNFTEITWNKQKLAILWQISEGLETIHKAGFIHRDFHSGNILSSLSIGKRYQWQICDLGLSQPCSSINFSKEYISMELDFDIDIERSKVLGTKRNIEELYIDDSHGNNDKYLLN